MKKFFQLLAVTPFLLFGNEFKAADCLFSVVRRHSGEALELKQTAPGKFVSGDLTLTVKDGVIRPVLTLPVETYLLGVVPYEMSDSFPLEALKAQAVCART